ncbi:MAG: protease [[Candidatus Thermochlorobacteriaceae] bacterium GBChlB]|nr:MAG: protease [[Candidatus Thermochlorobacteriaceae] bacterium GBChlB]
MGYYDDYRPGGFSIVPPAIKLILIANVSVFVFQYFTPLRAPLMEFGALWTLDSRNFEVWQLVTYMFMHGGLFHILFNMIALWMFGAEIENYWGTQQFTIYYFTCGIGAGLCNILLTSGGYPTVGASGAVYGVLLAFGMMFPDRYIYIYFLLPIKAKYLVIIYAVLELFASFDQASSGVAHFAHLGGMVVGFIYIKVMQREFPFQSWFEKVLTERQSYTAAPPPRRSQEDRIDEILDKISRSGYESLTSDEKRILLDASKDKN